MRQQQRREETRRALVESGSRVFASTPFDKARIADVIDPLGVTQGAFYFHFTNKHELALEIIRDALLLLEAASQRATGSADGVLAGLNALGDLFSETLQEHLIVRAGIRLMEASSEDFPEFPDSWVTPWLKVARSLCEGLEGRDMLHPALDPERAAAFVVAALIGSYRIAVMGRSGKVNARVGEATRLAVGAVTVDMGE